MAGGWAEPRPVEKRWVGGRVDLKGRRLYHGWARLLRTPRNEPPGGGGRSKLEGGVVRAGCQEKASRRGWGEPESETEAGSPKRTRESESETKRRRGERRWHPARAHADRLAGARWAERTRRGPEEKAPSRPPGRHGWHRAKCTAGPAKRQSPAKTEPPGSRRGPKTADSGREEQENARRDALRGGDGRRTPHRAA
ncbi:t130 [Tupaiid betaherpesvirus 1]|uniref:T130 n=1 Tax=Tupaiid herpesvirus 1 (strain 1) TaxID=10397 RepID=Q91TG6_TUHV1|nr:t130 [Tupaiid betaherpesvirus 1]AAK57181.1 t130 [Tupaiid betaherpesvirus 1]